MNTLATCRSSSRINRIAGSCSTSQDWLDLLNDAVRMLMNRGDFYGSVQKMKACIYNGCITWPRGVLTPLALNMCRGSVPLVNHWYEYDRIQRGDLLDYFAAGCCGTLSGVDGDTSPVFNPISCASGSDGVYIRFYPTDPTDVGKLVTVFGMDSNGTDLRSTYPDGTVQDGIQVSLTLPFATLDVTGIAPRNMPTLRHIYRIIKEVTTGPVYGYQYDAVNDVLLDLAIYAPNETNPAYRTTHLRGGCSGTACSTNPQQITALVKLEFVPVVNDNDLVQIDNLDAIAQMMQAIKLDDAYDPDQKRKMEAEAIRELNLELRTRLPVDQIPIELSPFGTALPCRHGVGRFV